MTDESKLLAIGKITWEEITPNHHLAFLDDCACIEIVRSRSWKRDGLTKPWKVVMFGNAHVCRTDYADLKEAKSAAEKEAIARIIAMAKRLPLSGTHEDARCQICDMYVE